MKTPQEVNEEIDKLLEENNCRIEVEFHDIKIKIIKNGDTTDRSNTQ